MTAVKSRSRVLAVVVQDAEGTPKDPTAGTDFQPIRAGTSLSLDVNSVPSDELVDDIEGSGDFVTDHVPKASISLYVKGGGAEGTPPRIAPFIKAAMGQQEDVASEEVTTSSSSAGTSSARAYLQMPNGDAEGSVGRAYLIKDGVNGHKVRNAYSGDGATDRITLNYNLNAAPASGVSTGRPTLWAPTAEGHPVLTIHEWQSSASGAAYRQMISDARTVGLAFNFTAKGLAELTVECEGLKGWLNPIKITASNKYFDFKDDDDSELNISLDEGWYDNIYAVLTALATKFDAASSDTATFTFSTITGKVTLATNGGTKFEILWNTGTNQANSIGTTLGFSVAADDTSAFTYTADNAMSYGTSQTPSYQSTTPFVVKHQELFIGDFTQTQNRKGSSMQINVGTPMSAIPDFTAAAGHSESQIIERLCTFSTVLTYEKHETKFHHDMVSNTETQAMFNAGQKDAAGNWIPGTVWNFWWPQLTIKATPLSDSDGIVVMSIEATAKRKTGFKGLYINQM